MNDVKIQWNNGSALIHLDGFLPCNQEDFKKFLKLICLDWEHMEDIKTYVIEYCSQKLAENKDKFNHCSNTFFQVKQVISENEDLMSKCKHPSGVYATENELIDSKKLVRLKKAELNEILKTAKTAKSNTKKFQKHIEIMQRKG